MITIEGFQTVPRTHSSPVILRWFNNLDVKGFLISSDATKRKKKIGMCANNSLMNGVWLASSNFKMFLNIMRIYFRDV